jgi:hypothetical protein
MASLQSGGSGSVSKSESQYICGVGKETDEEEGSLDAPPAAVVIDDDVAVVISDDEVVSVAVAAPVAPRPPAISCKDPVAGLSKDERADKLDVDELPDW